VGTLGSDLLIDILPTASQDAQPKGGETRVPHRRLTVPSSTARGCSDEVLMPHVWRRGAQGSGLAAHDHIMTMFWPAR